jgi:TolA-binding protein
MISGSRMRAIVAGLALAGTMLSAVPAAAQADADARLRKIEQEVRALQRSVFPGGDGRFFEPEVAPGTNTVVTEPVGPTTTAVTDILGRLDSIEAQLARLVSQTEINANDMLMLSSRVEVFENERNAKLAAEREAAEAKARAEAEAAAVAAAAPAPPTPERLAAVQAITKPSSGDAGDDEYVFGFRLWEAKFLPEAQQQLRIFVDKYPSHWRTSYGRNLLGRAYLDDGKPREAAPWLLQNYQSDNAGARAPDSLLFLADAMVAIGDTNRACIALAEFGEKYPAEAAGRLLQQYEAGRAKVTCN